MGFPWDFHGISHHFADIHRVFSYGLLFSRIGAGEPPDLGGALHAAGAAGPSRPLRCTAGATGGYGGWASEIRQVVSVVFNRWFTRPGKHTKSY